jgi:hypothetical protein
MSKEFDEKLGYVDNKLSEMKSELDQSMMNMGLKQKAMKDLIKDRKCLRASNSNRQ